MLCRVRTHGGRRARSSRNALQDPIYIRSSRPFLMCQDIRSDFFFSLLDQIDIGKHAICLVLLSQLGYEVKQYMSADAPPPSAGYYDLPVTIAPLCRPAKLISCSTKPSLPRSQMKFLRSWSLKPCPPQLKDGDKLYTSHL